MTNENLLSYLTNPQDFQGSPFFISTQQHHLNIYLNLWYAVKSDQNLSVLNLLNNF